MSPSCALQVVKLQQHQDAGPQRINQASAWAILVCQCSVAGNAVNFRDASKLFANKKKSLYTYDMLTMAHSGNVGSDALQLNSLRAASEGAPILPLVFLSLQTVAQT
jgi:hypothetical protein